MTKIQIPNNKSHLPGKARKVKKEIATKFNMNENLNNKPPYDLEERTFQFAGDARRLIQEAIELKKIFSAILTKSK